jgi:Skp family chaperone for outer membrane proteins
MRPRYTLPMLFATAALLSACASEKTPATADVAVSRAAVENATQAGAAELAPAELLSAREKMQRASRALADKDYKLASDLAQQAQADAKLAQSKATSSKATSAANEVQENVRVLREELDRANKQQ